MQALESEEAVRHPSRGSEDALVPLDSQVDDILAEVGGGKMEEAEPSVEVIGPYDHSAEDLRTTYVVPYATNEGTIIEGRKVPDIVEEANHLVDQFVGQLLHMSLERRG